MKRHYTIFDYFSAIVMMAALWLLTSANYWAYASKKGERPETQAATEKGTDSRTQVPNPTEEKTPGGLQNLSEYLHDGGYCLSHPFRLLPFYNGQGFMLIPVHHPELLTPPPKANA